MQIDMRIYTAAETKAPYFKRDYSLCNFVVQAHWKSLETAGFQGFFFAFPRAAHGLLCRILMLNNGADFPSGGIRWQPFRLHHHQYSIKILAPAVFWCAPCQVDSEKNKNNLSGIPPAAQQGGFFTRRRDGIPSESCILVSAGIVCCKNGDNARLPKSNRHAK